MARKKNTKKEIKNKISDNEKSKKEQIKSQNKILGNFFLGILFLILGIAIFWLISYNISNFEYRGIKFEIVKEGNLVLYNTQIPVIYQGKKIPYNFYLRNDPRKTGEEIPIEGPLELSKNLVMKSNESFNCDGEGIITIANLANLYDISGINVIRDENVSCDENGDYAVIELVSGESTRIEKVGTACYKAHIKDCEILKVTERLMIESFAEINKFY